MDITEETVWLIRIKRNICPAEFRLMQKMNAAVSCPVSVNKEANWYENKMKMKNNVL